MRFINIGFGNMVACDRVVAVVAPDSAPVKRLIQDAKDAGRIIDVTCGRRTRAVLITDSDHVILSAVQTETISTRLNDSWDDAEQEEEEEEEEKEEGDTLQPQTQPADLSQAATQTASERT